MVKQWLFSLHTTSTHLDLKVSLTANDEVKGSFLIVTNEKLKDADILFTLNAITNDAYSKSQTIVLKTKAPFVRGLPPNIS